MGAVGAARTAARLSLFLSTGGETMLRSRFSHAIGWRRALLVAVVLLVTGLLPVSAQEFAPFETGVQPLVDAGLMTVVDQTMDADGVQVTIQYAYADIQRIIVRLKLSGDYEQVLQDNIPNLVLRDDTGRQFSYSAMHSVTRDDDELAEVYDAIFYNQTTYQPIVGYLEIIDNYLNDKGDRIELQLDIGFTPTSALGMVLDAVDALEKSPAGPFGFIFGVPIYQPPIVKPVETRTVGEIAVTLQRVTVAPSETEVEVCYTIPDAQDWQPWIELTVDGMVAPVSGGNYVDMPMLDDTERCIEQRFGVFVSDATRALTVSIARLQTSVPDDPEAWQGLVAELGTHGIKAEAFPQRGTYFSIESTPEGMTDAELAEIIDNARENLRQSVEGPWVFEVALPE